MVYGSTRAEHKRKNTVKSQIGIQSVSESNPRRKEAIMGVERAGLLD